MFDKAQYRLKVLISGFLLVSGFTASGQTIFSEPFDEAVGSTGGNDNTGGVSWNTACSGCLSGDYFNIQGGTLQCDDTNGPGVWTSNSINITPCTGGITVSVDINEVNASNSLEECTSGCGCNCVDWVSFEYNLNNTGYVPFSHTQGGVCAEGCSGGTYILLGAINPGSNFTFSQCLSAGTSLSLRLSVQTWAQGEILNFDNITVACSNCALPIELLDFKAKKTGDKIELNWLTAAETNNDYFTIERSTDGNHYEDLTKIKAAGNSASVRKYLTYDYAPPASQIIYYRLKQTDFSGEYSYPRMVAIENKNTKSIPEIVPNPSESGVFTLTGSTEDNISIEILDHTGRKIADMSTQGPNSTIDLSSNVRGLYFVRVISGTETLTYKIIYN